MVKSSKKYLLIFSFFALIYWSMTWQGYGVYMSLVHKNGWNQVSVMRFLIRIGIGVFVGYFLSQIFLLKFRSSDNVKSKIFLNLLGVLAITFLTFFISMMRNPSSRGLVKACIDGRNDGSLFYILSRILNAEGLDIILCSFLAFLSGKICYKKTNLKTLIFCLMAWLLIIATNELVIQRFLTAPAREGELIDIAGNLSGVLIALIISQPYFWKK